MLSRGDPTISCPNIRQRTQETPYRAIPLANRNSIIREEGRWGDGVVKNWPVNVI